MTRTAVVSAVSLVLTAGASLIHPLACALAALVSVAAIIASTRKTYSDSGKMEP